MRYLILFLLFCHTAVSEEKPDYVQETNDFIAIEERINEINNELKSHYDMIKDLRSYLKKHESRLKYPHLQHVKYHIENKIEGYRGRIRRLKNERCQLFFSQKNIKKHFGL